MLALMVVLGTAAVWQGDRLVTALFPLWRAENDLLDPHWCADRLAIDHEEADRVIRMSIGLRGCVTLGGGRLCDPAEPPGDASTLVGNATLPTALLLATTLGWPAAGRTKVRRFVCLATALLLLWALDVPLALGAAFAQVWRDAVAPGTGSLLVAWGEFLQSGGHLALALVLAGGAIVASAGGTSPPNARPQ